MRDVEGVADLVESMGDPVLGEHLLSLPARERRAGPGGRYSPYSWRLSRRTGRPSLLARLAPVPSPRAEAIVRECSRSFGSGLGLFFGGISPALTRSKTLTQAEKFRGSPGSNARESRSRPPFLFAPSWQPTQWPSTNNRDGAASLSVGGSSAPRRGCPRGTRSVEHGN